MRRSTKLGMVAALFLVPLAGCPQPPGPEGSRPTATKTATGHHARVFNWAINKSVSPDSFDLLNGETGTAQFTIAVIKTAGEDTFIVDGQVCVTNEGNQTTQGLSIFDEVIDPTTGGSLASVHVSLSGRPELDPGERHCYPYHIEFQALAAGTFRNVAHVTVSNHLDALAGSSPAAIVSADFVIPSAADVFTNDTIHVSDNNGQNFTFNASGSQTYSKTFACADAGRRVNTATITETGQTSSAAVTVNCLGDASRLTATKTATGHRAQTFDWTISKTAVPDTFSLLDGESGTSHFTISLTKTAGSPAFFVDGEVCVTNSGNQATRNLSITDQVLAQVGTNPAEAIAFASIDVSGHPSIAPGETHCYPYRVAFTPVGNATHHNLAQVNVTNFAGHQPGNPDCPGQGLCTFGPDASTSFTIPVTPDTTTNDTVHVTDTNGQSFTFSAGGSQSYDKTFTCNADHGDQTNTATITETSQSASATVSVTCRCITSQPQQSSPIAISCHGTMLLNVNPDANSVTLFDPTTLPLATVTTEIFVGRDPSSVAIHPDDTRAYVANSRDGTVSIIDLSAQAVVQTLNVGVEPSALVLSPNASRLYVANSASNSLSVLDTITNNSIATVDLSAFGTAPRAISVTNNGDLNDGDETVFVAMFYAQLRPGKSAIDEGQDDEREGRVVAISAATNTPLGAPNPIILGPLAATGFNANGRLAPANGSTTPDVASTNPQTFTTPTGAYPNQLAAVGLQPGASRAYVVSTAASPNGPLRFNVMAQGLVSVFDTSSRLETTSGQTGATVRQTAPLNLNQGINLGTTPAPRLFLTNPVAIAWRPDGTDAWIAIQNSDLVVRMTVDGSGVPTVNNPLVAGPSTLVRTDLQSPAGLQTQALAPRGIVINAAGTRAFVSNYVGRSITTIDISNPTAPSTVGATLSTALPASGTPAANALLGQALFFTGRGPQGRMSSESWGGCIVCHPNGRSDNVTWMFDAGPRQTIPLDSTFNKSNPSDQRILNWSAVRDENHDFELNTRGVFGGRGLIDDDRLFFAFGGASGATPTDSALVEQFQQFTGAVSTTNDLAAGAALPTISARRDFAIATRDDNDHVFIIGGRSGAGQGSLVAASDAVIEFDPRANTLTPRSSTGFTLRHSLGAAAVRTSQGFRIYAIGGYADTSASASPVSTVEEYNPATDTWRTVASLPAATAQFGITVAGGINTADPLQLIHVVGGNAGSESAPLLVTAAFGVQRFTADPAGPGVWSNFNVAGLTIRRNHGAASVLRGVAARIFVIGGQDGAGTVLDTVEEYTNATVPALVATPHTPISTPSVAAPRARFGIAATKTTNQIYVMGGIDNTGADQTTILEYSVANNPQPPATAGPPGAPSGAWITRGVLSVARNGLQVSTPPGVTNFLTARSAGRDARQDAIALFVETIRSARAPLPATDANAMAGRTLFGTVGLVVPGFSCATCHGGAKWTRSQVDYTPPPSPADNVGLGVENVIGAELRKTALQPGVFPGVLVNVNTFVGNLPLGRVNELRSNPADISQVIAPLGSNGFNIPSLLSVHETRPYFYSGLAQTLEEVLNGSQDGSGFPAGVRHHFVPDAMQRAELIAFLRSIDETTPIFP